MKIRDQKGQTLLEVLIGTTILAIVIVGLICGMQAGIWGTKRVDERTTAINLAQSQMEYVKAQPYQLYDDQGNPIEGEGYSKIAEDMLPAGFSLDDIEIVVSNLGNQTSSEATQQVTITISHDGNKTYTISAYKRKG
jgi:type II secretory pathway pseudopilin PulG